MFGKRNLVSAGVVLVLCALLIDEGRTPRQVRAAAPMAEGWAEDEVVELKKRVTKLEAEVAEMRKALLLAGGAVDGATEIKRVREVAKVRCADLLQRTQNARALLREVAKDRVNGQELRNKINDLNNDLTGLWMTVAGYGLGTDPYLDNIRLSNSGFSRASPEPDRGIPGSHAGVGLPRLYERFLEASGVKDKAAEKAQADFKKLVQAYSNPAVYQHRAFGERAYDEYRNGKGLFTADYDADLKALDQWLTDLETVLGSVPGHFDKAP